MAKTSKPRRSTKTKETKARAAEKSPSVFDKAKAKSEAKKPKQTPKGTVLRIPDSAGKETHQAVYAYRQASAQEKSAKDRRESIRDELSGVVTGLLCDAWQRRGERPEQPLTVENAQGDRLSYVMQDGSDGAEIGDKEMDALQGVLGKKAAGLYETADEYYFDPDVLREPGVMQQIGKALQDVRDQELVERLLKCRTVTRLKPGLLEKLPALCGKGAAGRQKMADVLEAVRTKVRRFFKT